MIQKKDTEIRDHLIRIKSLEESQAVKNNGLSVEGESSRPKPKGTVEEFYAQVVYKDAKIVELTKEIDEKDAQILELQETLREKDQILSTKARAVQVFVT